MFPIELPPCCSPGGADPGQLRRLHPAGRRRRETGRHARRQGSHGSQIRGNFDEQNAVILDHFMT